MTPTQFRNRSLKRSRKNDTTLTFAQARLALYALGMAEEAGEVAGEVKKHIFHGKPLDPVKILNECGDELWYMDRMLSELGWTMEDAMAFNDGKLSKRYPDGFDNAARKFGFTAEEGA
jgi:NTP pyrophosphatase (non-canonical NTP hydrolase)